MDAFRILGILVLMVRVLQLAEREHKLVLYIVKETMGQKWLIHIVLEQNQAHLQVVLPLVDAHILGTLELGVHIHGLVEQPIVGMDNEQDRCIVKEVMGIVYLTHIAQDLNHRLRQEVSIVVIVYIVVQLLQIGAKAIIFMQK